MRVPSFRYLAPATVAEAARILREEGPGAKLLAGGTDLVPNMKRRQQVPSTLVALRKVDGLRGVAGGGAQELRLGAGVTLAALAREPRLGAPLRALAVAAGKVATAQIRNQATIGGNLCLDTRCNYYNQNYEWRQAIDFCKKAPAPGGTAQLVVQPQGTCWVAPSSPRCWAVSSSDTAPALIALGAEVTLVSAEGERRLPLQALYQDDGMDYLARRPDELLTEVLVPAHAPGWRSTYWKLRRRGSFDFPVLGVAAALRLEGGVVAEARLCLGAVASHPVSVPTDELVGQPLTDEVIAAFVARAAKPARPLDNTDYHLSWRKRMATAYLTGALRELRGDPPEALGLLARTAARLPVLA
ncbi:MAG: xanthine dehydrogenase family protein subunit M [Planctomycetota bacterium]